MDVVICRFAIRSKKLAIRFEVCSILLLIYFQLELCVLARWLYNFARRRRFFVSCATKLSPHTGIRKHPNVQNSIAKKPEHHLAGEPQYAPPKFSRKIEKNGEPTHESG